MTKVGLISDTHNYLSPQAEAILKTCHNIVCAGDLHSLKILRRLQALGPEVTVCRGNCDYGPWAQILPREAYLQVEDITIAVIHNLDYFELDPSISDISLVVYGHTHFHKQHYDRDVLYINPGSASEPRYGQTPSLAICTIEGQNIATEFISLD